MYVPGPVVAQIAINSANDALHLASRRKASGDSLLPASQNIGNDGSRECPVAREQDDGKRQ